MILLINKGYLSVENGMSEFIPKTTIGYLEKALWLSNKISK